MSDTINLMKRKIAETESLVTTFPLTIASSLINYNDIQEAIIQLELQEEIQTLNELLNGSEEGFEQRFKAHCLERAKRNENSCLNFTVMPEGICNKLYWDLIELAFGNQTWAERLAILMPNVKKLISTELRRDTLSNISVEFIENPLTTLQRTPQCQDLGEFVIHQNLLFDLSAIVRFNLTLHQEIYKVINKNYPDLATKLYAHNQDFNTLKNRLQQLTNAGATPGQMIVSLINSLRLGGQNTEGRETHLPAMLHKMPFINFMLNILSLYPLKYSENYQN
jgi:hypothetical protein